VLQRLTSIYIALLLTVFLLAFPRGGYEAIVSFKYSLFLLICGGYVVSIIVLRSWYAATRVQPAINIAQKLRELPLPIKFLLAFLLFSIASALLSPHPGVILGNFRNEGVLTLGIYVLSCIFVAAYFQPQKWMFYLLGAGVTLTSTLALVQLTGANPFGLYPIGHNYYGAGIYYSGEFLSTIGNAGLLGGFLSLAVGILAMAIIKLDFKERWFLAIPLFIAVLLVFSMGINAAVLAVTAGLVIMIPISVTNQRTRANTFAVLSVILAAYCLSRILVFQDGYVLFGLHLWQYSGTSGSMVYEASQILQGNWDDSFGSQRIFIWRNVLESIQLNTLLFGTGPDTLGHWAIPPFTRYNEHLGITLTNIIDAAHNEFLHIMATTGLLSLLAYLGAMLTVAVGWFRQCGNALSATTGAGVLFYVIQSFFGISQFITAPFFWACFGMLIYAQNRG